MSSLFPYLKGVLKCRKMFNERNFKAVTKKGNIKKKVSITYAMLNK